VAVLATLVLAAAGLVLVGKPYLRAMYLMSHEEDTARRT
jgi:hypothetical protein